MNLPDDLTNLNWVSGAPVPIPSVSPPGSRGNGRSHKPFIGLGSAKKTIPVIATTPKKNGICGSASSECKKTSKSTPRRVRRSISNSMSISGGDRPKCSYTCLIGMAMQASPYADGCLPVHEIYKYIEKEFPYFKTAPDGWKNSVRHNLSLNPSFRKVHRSDGWQGKKGHFWEMTPEKKKLVDEEVRQFLASEGRTLEVFCEIIPPQQKDICGEDVMFTKPCEKKTKGKKKKAKRKLKFSEYAEKSASKPPSLAPRPNTPNMVKEYSKDMQEQLLNSEVSVVPTLSPTQTALDTNHAPTTYIGINPPSNDPSKLATELFGLNENPQDQSLTSINNAVFNPNMTPFIAPVSYCGVYGYPPAFVPDCNAMSPIVSPTTALTPIGSPFVTPQYIQCVPFNPYMGIVPGQPMFLSPPPEMFLHTPVSVEILDSSQEMEIGEVIELIEDNFCAENAKSNECNQSVNVVENVSTHRATNSPHYVNSSIEQECNSVQNRLSLSELNSIEDLDNSTQKTKISLEDLKLMFGEDYCKLTEEEIVSTLMFLNQQARQQRHTNTETTEHTSGLMDEPIDQELVQITNEIETVESYLNCGQQFSQSEHPNGCHLYTVKADVSSLNASISESRMDYSSDKFTTSIPRLESLLHLNDRNIECIEGALRLDVEQEVVVSSCSTVTVDVET